MRARCASSLCGVAPRPTRTEPPFPTTADGRNGVFLGPGEGLTMYLETNHSPELWMMTDPDTPTIRSCIWNSTPDEFEGN